MQHSIPLRKVRKGMLLGLGGCSIPHYGTPGLSSHPPKKTSTWFTPASSGNQLVCLLFFFPEFFRISFYNFLRYLSKCTELKQQLIITDLLRSDTPTFKIPLVQLCPLTLQYSLSTAEAQKCILLKRHGLIPTNTASQSRKHNFQSSKWKKHTTLHI